MAPKISLGLLYGPLQKNFSNPALQEGFDD